MGALPPISPWIPEDDLLLKNAVEAGASLESLAKGAVRFSRRFTIRELQERWHSLLYDPDISVESAENMMELERSASSLPYNKPSKVDTSKDNGEGHKRKVQSVRSYYYALRKRIRSDPLNQGDLDILVPAIENFYGNGNESAYPSNILDDPVGCQFELGNANFVCPENMGHGIDGASHEFDNRDMGQFENHPIEQCDEIAQMAHNNVTLGGNSTAVGGIDSLKEISVENLFEDNFDANNMNNSDANKNRNINPCLEGNHVFNSPVLECEASFHHLQCSTPPAMHEWRNLNSMSGMDLTGDSHLIGESQDIEDPFRLPNEVRKSSSEYDVVHSETDFESHMACDEMKASCSQYDLVALSDTLLNLSDDDMLLMDDDEKEIDKYGLSNLLLDSPSDMNEDQMLDDVTQVDTKMASEADLHICSSVSPGQSDKGDSSTGQFESLDKGDNSTGQLNKNDSDFNTSSRISVLEEPKLSSVSDTNPQIDKLCKEVICCVLNTEDLEVPNNDHVIFPTVKPTPSLNRRGFNEITRRESSIKGNLHKLASESGLTLVNRELKIFGELHTDSQARGHKMGLNHPGKRDANLQLPKSANFNTNSRHPGNANCSTVIIRTVASENISGKQPYRDIPDLPVKSSDVLLSSKEKQERQAVKNLEVFTQSETADEMVPEAVMEPFLSDVEEEPSDYDDDDIPCVSDVEIVVHDMELLGAGDLDSYASRPVAKYQTDDAKRGIIRSEQSWDASRHRDIAAHGAFAYLYGCNKKTYYIKKLEVLIGRATKDFFVDIDLGKERRANRISRREAFIKIDENGEFHLRNLGKCPIEINGKEVYPGQSLILPSDSHIKVKGMDFTFKKNQACVKQYLDAISRTIPPN
ncbi:hypothetical protein V2J09_007230 [Rumex salicifolius]